MFFSYLKRHWKIIILLTVFVCIAAAVFSLYRLPVEAVVYTAVLCFAAGAMLFFLGYAGWARRHRYLKAMKKTILLSLDGLPEPSGVVERDYQELLELLWNEKNRVSANADTQRAEQIDYYTMWAHQIKTPIAAMRLLLEDENTDAAAVGAELFRIEEYVEMVLGYLRLGSESTDYVFRPCRVDAVVRSAVRKYARFFIQKKLTLTLADTGLTVVTDEKWLLFVVEQVLSNALKYTRRGGVSIHAQGDTLVIADTGIGVRAEDLPRVFDKGFTGMNGREDKKSTGIGLYLCRMVCDRLGHGISISSVPGSGTQVCIDLRRRESVME